MLKDPISGREREREREFSFNILMYITERISIKICIYYWVIRQKQMQTKISPPPLLSYPTLCFLCPCSLSIFEYTCRTSDATSESKWVFRVRYYLGRGTIVWYISKFLSLTHNLFFLRHFSLLCCLPSCCFTFVSLALCFCLSLCLCFCLSLCLYVCLSFCMPGYNY